MWLTEDAHHVSPVCTHKQRLGLRLQELVRDLVRGIAVRTRFVETLARKVVVEELLQLHRNIVSDVLNEDLRVRWCRENGRASVTD